LRIWSYAQKQRQTDPIVYGLMNNPETPLKELSEALKRTSPTHEDAAIDQSMQFE
jgi:hypothetical protein